MTRDVMRDMTRDVMRDVTRDVTTPGQKLSLAEFTSILDFFVCYIISQRHETFQKLLIPALKLMFVRSRSVTDPDRRDKSQNAQEQI